MTLEIRRQLEQDFRAASEAWLDRAPDSAAAHQEVGDMYLRAFRASNDTSLLEGAVYAYRRAVERYPNSNILRAHLAWTYSLTGETAAAAKEAARAIELDDVQPHADVRLENDFQRLSDPVAGPSNTRWLMEQLVNGASIDGHPAPTIE
jgi:tetratricopeptide (TPR) repeat protein